MSVIVTVWVKGDPAKLEQYAAENSAEMQAIAEDGKQHGVIAHRFYGTDDGQIMVIDQWPDGESFQTFFEKNRDRIGPLMQAGGAQGEPGVNIWRELDTGDAVGWGA